VSAPPPEALPHAYPFRLVERSEVIDGRRVALVLATANGSEPLGAEWPVTLVAEAMAQAILLVVRPPSTSELRLVGLNKVRLLQPVRPGSRLEVEVEEQAAFAPLRRYACRAHSGGALAATAEITVSG
jgi:3-hydroxymyristoyl/3-hydroxydecanoyl-(acyl carrier protein) dehydratase